MTATLALLGLVVSVEAGFDATQRYALLIAKAECAAAGFCSFNGLKRLEIEEAAAGDIIAFTGVADLRISDTLCDPDQVEALPALTVDEPTVSMNFQVNKSPFAGRDGTFLTSRQIGERLRRELTHNVALRVEATDDPDTFKVSGRGELHLSILIENMRREGYELGVSRPHVHLNS